MHGEEKFFDEIFLRRISLIVFFPYPTLITGWKVCCVASVSFFLMSLL